MNQEWHVWKNYERWLCHKYDVNYMIMQSNMTIWCVSYERNGGKLHGNISRNGYGNAMIGRYGCCFEEGIWWVYGTGESCAVQERLAMVALQGLRSIATKNVATTIFRCNKMRYYHKIPFHGNSSNILPQFCFIAVSTPFVAIEATYCHKVYQCCNMVVILRQLRRVA